MSALREINAFSTTLSQQNLRSFLLNTEYARTLPRIVFLIKKKNTSNNRDYDNKSRDNRPNIYTIYTLKKQPVDQKSVANSHAYSQTSSLDT